MMTKPARKNPFDATFAYRHRGTLAAALAAGFLANAVLAAVTYPVARSVRSLRADAEATARRVENLDKTRARVAAAEAMFRDNREDITYFYEDILSTKRDRLTYYLREIRQMARAANLQIPSITHTTESPKDQPDIVRFGSSLPVEGTYDSLRRFISAVENHPDLFLTVNRIALRSAVTGRFDQIKFDMTVSTHFMHTDADAEPPAAEAEAEPDGDSAPNAERSETTGETP